MNKITDYIKSVIKEIRAITWPSRRRVYNDTMVVLFSLIVGGIIIAIVDYSLAQLVKFAVTSLS